MRHVLGANREGNKHVMSQRGTAPWGRRSRRATARPESRVKRTLVALGTVILVITPISWILLHEPQADQADASVPYVTRDDDTYIDSSTQPVTATPSVTEPGDSPTPDQTTGTPKPSATPSTPGRTPSTAGPTDTPTSAPTDGPGTTTAPSDPPETNDPRPSTSPSDTPSSTPTKTTPPPPSDDGSMRAEEEELFALVDNARVERGCAPLERNSNLTGGARQDAGTRAGNGDVSDGDSSMAATGGDGVTAKAAFDQLKSERAGTVFNCGLQELGVGRGTANHKVGALCPLVCSTRTRVAWVADFK